MTNEKHRFRQLINYPLLKEEMEISQDFINDNFEENFNMNSIAIEISSDKENYEQNKLNLIVQLSKASGYLELVFYFNITNKKKDKITSNPKYIYDRNTIKNHLPKNMVNKNIFKQKIIKMTEKLIKQKKPKHFFLTTYEDYKDEKQISYYRDIIKLLLNNGYNLSNEGVNHEKRYYWEFSEKTLKEIESTKKGCPIIKDEKYWAAFEKEADMVMEEFVKRSREKDNKK